MQLSLVGPPVPDPRPWLKLWSAPPGAATEALILTQQLVTLELHHVNGRTLPCTLPGRACPHCAMLSQPRWGAYLAVQRERTNKPDLVCLPKGAWEHSRTLQAADGRMRGLMMIFQRLGEDKNSPLAVRVGPLSGPLARMTPIPQVDLVAALSRMWRLPGLTVVAGDPARSMPRPSPSPQES